VEELLPRLFAESASPMLIHGDLHHFNILSSERGWIAIDPKGVIGHPEYEVGPLLINPMPDFLNGRRPKVRMERRIAILSERLGFSRQSIRDWGVCHAVLSAWWDMSPDGKGGEYSLHCAELISVC
jgi:streptomycin 6-kinase